MNREVHVQFWEGVGLRCPALLTYLNDYRSYEEVVERLPEFIDQVYNTQIALGLGLFATSAIRGATYPATGPIYGLIPVQSEGFTPNLNIKVGHAALSKSGPCPIDEISPAILVQIDERRSPRLRHREGQPEAALPVDAFQKGISSAFGASATPPFGRGPRNCTR